MILRLRGVSEDIFDVHGETGQHVIAVELSGARAEQRVLVNAAEKDRLLVFQLVAPPPPRRPVVPFVLSSASVVGVVLFAVLGGTGRSQQSALLESPCAATMTCAPASVSAVRSLYAAADISLVLGLVAAGLAVWQWWAWF